MSENSEQIVLDFSKLKLERGETPVDIKDTCFALCRDYLGGVWLQLTIDEVVVNRLSGGLTNQLYYCAVNEEHRRSDAKEPQEVAIRLYGEKHFNNIHIEGNERLSDTIIAVLMSDNCLGPKIFGLFEGGQIQKYYQHKSFRAQEMNDPILVKELSRKLAKIHAMEVPIKRTGNWVFETFDNLYNLAENGFDLKSLYEENDCKTLKEHDIKGELDWIKRVIIETDSPENFIHVDFRGSNIMVTERDGIVLCDLEYSCYGYRGTDFGTIFAEWDTVWGEFGKPQDFPKDEKLKPFIESYIEESVKLRGKAFTDDKRNSFEHILKEGKLFTLVSNMFFILFTLKSNESIIPDIPFDKNKSMVFCDIMFKNYHYLKRQFISQNLFH